MIMVHHYLVKDGVDVCKYCGMVRNKDRVGPQYCPGKLPPIEARAEIIDEWKAANGYDDLIKAKASQARQGSARLGSAGPGKAEAHRLAHKLRDPKFYTARTKRAVNSMTVERGPKGGAA